MVAAALPERIRKQIEALPARPGVYLMRNAKGEVIYVGKAARLKDRVRSYFGSPRSLEPKTRALRADIEDFEYIVCANAGEALILEATLIKRHQPFFNIRLKDDKRYPYLKIDVQNPWPRVYITRRIEKDGARYFGPYASAGSVRASLDLLKKLFPYRSCTKPITGTDPRPCLDYYIKRCIAPCTAYCTEDEYAEVIDQIILFLEGKASDVLGRLEEQMDAAAEALDYERAAMLRDQMRAIERTVERQMLSTTKKEDLDVYGLAREGDRACVQVFFVRGTQMTGRDHFVLEGVTGESDGAVLGSLLQQYYESAQSIPRLVVTPIEPEGRAELEAMLAEKRGANVEIRVARRGEKRRLLEMAGENAAEALDVLKVRWLSDQTKTATALEELREELALPEVPHRIECYDNSNTQGASPVSSMVVFLDGQPAPRQYRKFRIKTVEGADDFATMQEVLRRRFKRAAKRIEQQRLAESGNGDAPADGDTATATTTAGTCPTSSSSMGGRGSCAPPSRSCANWASTTSPRWGWRSATRSCSRPTRRRPSSCRAARRRSTSCSACATRRTASPSRITARCGARPPPPACSTPSPAWGRRRSARSCASSARSRPCARRASTRSRAPPATPAPSRRR